MFQQLKTLRTLRAHTLKACRGPLAITTDEIPEYPTFADFIEIPYTYNILLIHRELGLVVCRLCQCGLLPEFMFSHVRNHHKKTINLSQTVTELTGVVPAVPGDARLCRYLAQDRPPRLEALAVLLNAFRCNTCGAIYGSKESIGNHKRSKHKGEVPRPTVQHIPMVQSLFKYRQHFKYFECFDINNDAQEQLNYDSELSQLSDDTVLPHPFDEYERSLQQALYNGNKLLNSPPYVSQIGNENFDLLHSPENTSKVEIEDFDTIDHQSSIESSSIEEMVDNRNRLRLRITKWFKKASQ